jgi:hypothetical protein
MRRTRKTTRKRRNSLNFAHQACCKRNGPVDRLTLTEELLLCAAMVREGSTHGAQTYGDNEAKRILGDEALTAQVVELFTVEKLTTREILTRLRDALGLIEETDIKTRMGVLERVIRARVKKALCDSIRSHQRSQVSMVKIAEGRDRKHVQAGHVVFTPEELEYLLELRKLDSVKISTDGRCDNDWLAEEMNLRFGTTKFTADNCRLKAANYAFRQKKKKNIA